nr:MAG TPA: hypothetical protein [Caudoviricetes sp.]
MHSKTLQITFYINFNDTNLQKIWQSWLEKRK